MIAETFLDFGVWTLNVSPFTQAHTQCASEEKFVSKIQKMFRIFLRNVLPGAILKFSKLGLRTERSEAKLSRANPCIPCVVPLLARCGEEKATVL